ncbi:uncharacterized protein APUU_70313A [Aspergillus puulaauensis]|uniref:Uncharacterized protein n=1 Tax=Aspergillus puulaauensis TaxID=1220207 RepID=A0A7R7XXM7_9EURO|nr:uncharacterized protein APUU_70313A [Aspergillus puulaauensis]BCS28743.1 hypothetical protein APUU_70313A [Aspergillus puulaauensis]
MSTVTVTMRDPCASVSPAVKGGFLHTIWSPFASFFHTFGSVIGFCLTFIFGTLLPGALALIVLVLSAFAFWELLCYLARKSGLAAWYASIDDDIQEKKRKEREEKGDLETGAENIDAGDEKKRVEVEIQVLENLLLEKKRELDSLE